MPRRLCLFIAVVFLVLVAVECRAVGPSGLDPSVMKVSLRAGTDEERQYIDVVVALADAGYLPTEVVQGTFLWAKKKARYKFQYFRYGLETRLKGT